MTRLLLLWHPSLGGGGDAGGELGGGGGDAGGGRGEPGGGGGGGGSRRWERRREGGSRGGTATSRRAAVSLRECSVLGSRRLDWTENCGCGLAWSAVNVRARVSFFAVSRENFTFYNGTPSHNTGQNQRIESE